MCSKKASKPAPSVPAMEDTTKTEVVKAGGEYRR